MAVIIVAMKLIESPQGGVSLPSALSTKLPAPHVPTRLPFSRIGFFKLCLVFRGFNEPSQGGLGAEPGLARSPSLRLRLGSLKNCIYTWSNQRGTDRESLRRCMALVICCSLIFGSRTSSTVETLFVYRFKFRLMVEQLVFNRK